VTSVVCGEADGVQDGRFSFALIGRNESEFKYEIEVGIELQFSPEPSRVLCKIVKIRYAKL
jgi:hypothetical protein